ncbi:UDP-N-acetylglucosamine 2-epimerase (non-hydrolyzing) [Aureibaculum sp. 2210JD6-5]|uniref:non-hydrolyzing UDP-N-acetylglucosamine 2-epimerase n=1 Tax=Aureibaculum sp. 2210JD6-5 TaxID=3103957 RepID=UPI002AAD7C03|nr:UDP-N-acetylglucosamine 2-epimerase (non-hydrolyzing) [Aureibaculum sp. 2210JD6-5]MDY7394201.1 UDP-N-acetylglucosamine 2-epimerase (non-hydrolyzing) [Aureibaculum sp. 2210JD6-5]
MKKILTVFGTRPEAIKMAVLAKELNRTSTIDHKLCVTGQHREMLDQVLDLFELIPDFDLNIMQHGQDLSDVTARILLCMRDLFKNEWKPDLVLVHGDTSTCFTTALAAFYAGIKVGHVEAGLRTGNMQSPFPEEANRVLVSKITNFHFAPTDTNVQNLLCEGVSKNSIIKTGNTVIDSLLYISNKLTNFSNKLDSTILPKLVAENKKYVLITGHRRENFGGGFIQICEAIKELAIKNSDFHFVYPVHLNPNVQEPVKRLLIGLNNVQLIDPLEYQDFVFAMKHCYLVLTDSGGVQEEAPSLGKPVLVMRDTTERPEAVAAGTVQLVGANKENIINGVQLLIDDKSLYSKMTKSHNPYGDGYAVKTIIKFLSK